jgi:hypothetical protein
LEYNAHMNHFPAYSLERVDATLSDIVGFHNQAGFLGVYGNINFSTFLHGCCVLMLVDNEDEANVAGDDAHYKERHGFEDISDRVILANGIFEPSKTFMSDEIGAVCLKRGVVQIETRILPKPMVVFPSFSNIGELFGYYPPQFPRQDNLSKSDRRKKVGNELFRFFRHIYAAGIKDHLDEAHDLLRAIYESASLPKYGSLPPYSDILVPVLPDDPIALIEISPLDNLLRHHFSGGAVLPKIYQDGDNDESQDPNLIAGNSWSGTLTQKLKYLEVLEYVVKTEMTEVFWGVEAYNRIVDMYYDLGSKVYEFECVADVPYFLANL